LTGLVRMRSLSEQENWAAMQDSLWKTENDGIPFARPIDAALEVGAYESLWALSERFAREPGTRPSDLVEHSEAQAVSRRVLQKLWERTSARFRVRLHGETEYPDRLRDATHPIELFYFQGDWNLVFTRSVAVVGTRKPSSDGIARTRNLVRKLVADDFTIVSGLAEGIDTAAHETTLAADGNTIAVIGTPLGTSYPKGNAKLQKQIAENYLLISQVPVERYDSQTYRGNRFFFPERNKTMAALTEATIIVEAGETSGTLVQAREALKQGRKLFILNSCFERTDISWPRRFEAEGAIRVRSYADIRQELVS
jgi:DNA processing protein